MSVLLISEHNNKEVRPFTYNAITAASQINEDLHVLVLGHQAAVSYTHLTLPTKA